MSLSDEKVNEFIGRSGTISIDQAKAFINLIEKNTSKGDTYYWAITLKEQDSLIGTICLWNISEEKEHSEIGYELLPPFQGKGIMQEAISKVIAFGFNEIKLKVITALPKEGNSKSIKLLLRNNFQLDTNNKYVGTKAADGLLVYYLTPDITESKDIQK